MGPARKPGHRRRPLPLKGMPYSPKLLNVLIFRCIRPCTPATAACERDDKLRWTRILGPNCEDAALPGIGMRVPAFENAADTLQDFPVHAATLHLRRCLDACVQNGKSQIYSPIRHIRQAPLVRISARSHIPIQENRESPKGTRRNP